MIGKPLSMRVLCWMCVVLAVSTCTGELCFAQGADSTRTADSTQVELPPPEIYEDVIPVRSITPGAAADDSLAAGTEETKAPIYRKWWVWALVTIVIGVAVALVAGGTDEKADEDLPDFPDPPDR